MAFGSKQMTRGDLVRLIQTEFNGGTYEHPVETVADRLLSAVLAGQAPEYAKSELTVQRIDQHIRALQLLRERA